MTRDQAASRLEQMRAHLSHDIFQNGFGGILQPGWRDDRLSDRDIVLRALHGDPEGNTAVGSAVEYWRSTVSPMLNGLVDSVTSRFGFVTTPVWDGEVAKMRVAADTIEGVLSVPSTSDANDRAARFWQACDVVGGFLVCVRRRSSDFFERWDPSLASPDQHS
jgi:hypothetical protein